MQGGTSTWQRRCLVGGCSERESACGSACCHPKTASNNQWLGSFPTSLALHLRKLLPTQSFCMPALTGEQLFPAAGAQQRFNDPAASQRGKSDRLFGLLPHKGKEFTGRVGFLKKGIFLRLGDNRGIQQGHRSAIKPPQRSALSRQSASAPDIFGTTGSNRLDPSPCSRRINSSSWG